MSFDSYAAEFMAEDRRRSEALRAGALRDVREGASRMWRRVVATTIALTIAYFVLSIPLAWHQSRLIYWNDVTAMTDLSMPKGWAIREYVSQDADVQYAAYVHAGEKKRPTVVYLHGRGEGFGIFEHNVAAYVQRGWTVVVPEYPGFAGLSGEPNEHVIKAYMGKVYDDLLERGVDPRLLLIHGNSLGAGPALQLAQFPHGFLFLSAPVGDMKKLVARYIPYYPTMFLRDRWDNGARAATRYRANAMLVHAADDLVVPIDQGRDLARRGRIPMRTYAEGGHAIADLDRGITYESGRFAYGG